jgi:alpha-galactosidase
MEHDMKTIRHLSWIIGLMLAVSFTLTAQNEETIALNTGWRFTPGDNPLYASATFDDGHWKPVLVNRIWEEQGYDTLDGFGWYRVKFLLPSRLRSAAYLKDSLRVFLGKINNFDQAFLNGSLFGINGATVPATASVDSAFMKADVGMWNVARRYIISADDARIRWDQENVIAVRVFDQGGQGGMWSGDQEVGMLTLREYLKIEAVQKPFDFTDDQLSKKFLLRNTSSQLTLSGNFSIDVRKKLTGEQLSLTTQLVTLVPGASQEITLTLSKGTQAMKVAYGFEFFPTHDRMTLTEEAPYILTPPGTAMPRLNGPMLYGARPGRPFLFGVPVSGVRPITVSAKGLPEGLILDGASGVISGIAPPRGEYNIHLTASNALGTATRDLTIVIGDKLALTPPMGWNSWNCWGTVVDQEKVLASARAFTTKGLADHGWSYINIDDGWEIKGDSPEPKRDSVGRIRVNEKFPSMRLLGDSIHVRGLKFGIYSSPGPQTCAGYTGTRDHELDDAHSYAEWGVDYLKYDWCSYDKFAKDTSRAELQKPYRAMRDALNKVPRDIVYSLCQYGMGNVWEWGAEVGGNSWRTTGDITDTWASMSGIGFSQVTNGPFAGPGHWNDPDMLVVGWVGWGPSLHPTNLTPDEQYTHISLWCLLSSPLLIGCDLERLDPFTLNLLTNDEVLAVNQDPLGRQAHPVVKTPTTQVWVKDLYDGGKAVGFFSLGDKTEEVELDLHTIGLGRNVRVRDLWRQVELGGIRGKLVSRVGSHGVMLFRITPVP